jgi:carbamoyltransferase
VTHRFVLGISGLYHDSAAAVLRDGEVVAAVHEERLSRIRHDPSFPVRAIRSCIEQAGVPEDGLVAVAFYEKPLTAAVRVLKSFTASGLRGLRAFPRAVQRTTREHLWVGYSVERALRDCGIRPPERVLFAEHHQSHAAAAFHPSPFDEAAVLTFDGVGEWATTTIGHGVDGRVELLEEIRFPDSIGLLYSALTSIAGFSVNGGEYKLMGLAPFGEPTYVERIREHVLRVHDDGSFEIDQRYLDYVAGSRMTNRRLHDLLDGPPRGRDEPITRRDCDLARSAQVVVEDLVLRVAAHARDLTGCSSAVLAGGVALNCVANGRLLRDGPFDDVWVQPAAGDAGSALGCALWAWHEVLGEPRPGGRTHDSMHAATLGPLPNDGAPGPLLERSGWPFEHLPDDAERAERVARLLADGQVVAVCHGPSEFGPRALGNRSILADPRSADARENLNGKVKFRESFRPFAPIVPEEDASEWFVMDRPSPYMSFVVDVRGATPVAPASGEEPSAVPDLQAALRAVDSPIPAVTHVDGTARVQTVAEADHPELHRILRAFGDLTGCPVLVNTSFNVRGEPIVQTVDDAYRCFVHTGIDWLLVDDCLLSRRDQPAWSGPEHVVAAD